MGKGPFKYYVSMILAFLGPPTYISVNITVDQQKLPFLTQPTHLFADIILEWSQSQLKLTLDVIQKIYHQILTFSSTLFQSENNEIATTLI